MNNTIIRSRNLTLFICSGCEGCEAALAYLQEWARVHSGITLEALSIFDCPDEVVVLGIEYTPALVADGQLVASGMSPAEIQAWLEAEFA